MSSSTRSSALTATAGSVDLSIFTSACIMLSECSLSYRVSRLCSVSVPACASVWRSVIAPLRSPPLLLASVFITISSACSFSLSSILCSALVISVISIVLNSISWLFVLSELNLLSQGSFAVSMIGNCDCFMRSASAATPPLSVPAIPFISSISMIFPCEKRLCCFIAFPTLVLISAAFLSSDAFISISSSPSFLASACTVAVFPVPVGPCSSSAFFFCFL